MNARTRLRLEIATAIHAGMVTGEEFALYNPEHANATAEAKAFAAAAWLHAGALLELAEASEREETKP